MISDSEREECIRIAWVAAPNVEPSHRGAQEDIRFLHRRLKEERERADRLQKQVDYWRGEYNRATGSRLA